GGLYLQDEFRVSDKFKVTGGIRVDVPFYLNELQPNNAVSALNFLDLEGQNQNLDVSNWPGSAPLISPGIGFNLDVKGDRSIQVRGGTGIFTGRIPFVWLTNMPTNSGVLQNTVERVGQAVTDLGIKFEPEADAWQDKFPQQPGTSAPGSIAAVDENFK